MFACSRASAIARSAFTRRVNGVVTSSSITNTTKNNVVTKNINGARRNMGGGA